jgi:hypothetical protein
MAAAAPVRGAPQNPTTHRERCRAPTAAHGRPDPREPQRGYLSSQVRQRLCPPGPQYQHRADLRRDRPEAAQPAVAADRHRGTRRHRRPAVGRPDPAVGGRPAARPALRPDQADAGRGGRFRGAARLRVAHDPALGRPAVRRLAGVRPERARLRGAGAAVRLQQRLPGHPGPQRAERSAVLQSRVCEPEHHVPADHQRGDRPGADQGHHGRRRLHRRRAAPERQGPAMALRAGRGPGTGGSPRTRR